MQTRSENLPPVKKRLGRSLGLQTVFEYLPKRLVIQMQAVCMRFYYDFAVGLVTKMELWQAKGYLVKGGQLHIKVFDPNFCTWSELVIQEEGDERTAEEKQEYFYTNNLMNSGSI
jgi:hypothetical protein